MTYKKEAFIVIVTGPSRSGKDTVIGEVIKTINETNEYKAFTSSSVGEIKEFLAKYSISADTQEGRKVISDVKQAIDAYDFKITRKHLADTISQLIMSNNTHAFIQVRESECIQEIKSYVASFNTFSPRGEVIHLTTLKVISDEAIKNCPDNEGDRSSLTVKTDIEIKNNGSLEDLLSQARSLANTFIGHN